ncbi:MAG: amino acid ABC transporter permease [Desulfobacterales bacterium]|nr:amino acid ABC transporter permease [Desulfobacterales bacterium]
MVSGKINITKFDLILGGLLVAALVLIAYKVSLGLNYNWNWGAMPQYFIRFDPDAGQWVPNILLQGFLTTIRLSIWATLLASLIGIVMGMLRISQSLFKRMLAGSYVEFTRNLPPLVLIFIFYFFVSDQILPALGIETFVRTRSENTQALMTFLFTAPPLFTAFISALITLSIFEGAYMTEIVRAGIQSIEKGQWEAADALGLSKWHRMRFIILPQAIQRILPPLAGQFISTIKDSAIVSVISIQELTFQGMELMATTYLTFEIWITITAMYLVLTLACSLGVAKIENALSKNTA